MQMQDSVVLVSAKKKKCDGREWPEDLLKKGGQQGPEMHHFFEQGRVSSVRSNEVPFLCIATSTLDQTFHHQDTCQEEVTVMLKEPTSTILGVVQDIKKSGQPPAFLLATNVVVYLDHTPRPVLRLVLFTAF